MTCPEAFDCPDLGHQEQSTEKTDPRNRVQPFDRRVIAPESLDLLVELTYLGREYIVQAKQAVNLVTECRRKRNRRQPCTTSATV